MVTVHISESLIQVLMENTIQLSIIYSLKKMFCVFAYVYKWDFNFVFIFVSENHKLQTPALNTALLSWSHLALFNEIWQEMEGVD